MTTIQSFPDEVLSLILSKVGVTPVPAQVCKRWKSLYPEHLSSWRHISVMWASTPFVASWKCKLLESVTMRKRVLMRKAMTRHALVDVAIYFVKINDVSSVRWILNRYKIRNHLLHEIRMTARLYGSSEMKQLF